MILFVDFRWWRRFNNLLVGPGILCFTETQSQLCTAAAGNHQPRAYGG